MADIAQGEQTSKTRPPPMAAGGTLGWLRRNLFSSWGNALTTIVLVFVVARIGMGQS